MTDPHFLIGVPGTFLGGAPIEDCLVSLSQVFSDGLNELAATWAVTLEPGDTAPLDFQWAGSEVVGDVQWIFSIDPDEVVAESDEGNNRRALTVPIRESHGIEVDVAMDRETYAPTSITTISVAMLATGLAQDYELTLILEDEAGDQVAVIDNRTLHDFGPGTITFDVSWLLPNLIEGSYRVRLEVSGGAVASAMDSFEVILPGNLVARVSADRTSYPLGSLVNFVGTLTNLAAMSQEGLIGTFTIEAIDGGAVIATEGLNLPPVPAGGSVTTPWSWRADGVSTGAYRVGFAVTDSSAHEVARSTWFQFAVTEGPHALSGSVGVSPVRLEPTGVVFATAEIRNAGAVAVNDLPVSLLLVEPGSWDVLTSVDGVVDVPAVGSVEFQGPLSVDSLELGQYLVVLLAGSGNPEQLASVALTLADLTPPELELISPAAGVMCGEATFSVHAWDAWTTVFEVYYTADGEPQRYPMFLQPEADGGDVFSATWTLSPEQMGEHSIVIGARDIMENESPGLSFAFTSIIDETPPVVVIGGIPTSSCSNQPVIPLIDASDQYLASVTAVLNGEPYIEGTPIVDEGNYTLVVTARDDCGNETVESAIFSIDTGPPVIEVSGVADGECLMGPVAINYGATDANLALVSATVNGKPFADGEIIEVEGEYILVVTASDTCGNETTETLGFTLDNVLPVITIEGVEDGECSNEAVIVEFSASDDHLAGVSAMLNDWIYASGKPVTDEGDYLLIVTATEECGRTTSESRSFVIDMTPPVITVTGIEDGQTSPDAVTLDWVVEDANPTTVDARLDGAVVLPPVTVEDLGEHVLEVSAKDCAGNEAIVTVSFTIESQGPPPLTGDLTVVPESVERGQLVTLTAVVANDGGEAVADIFVEVVIVPEAGGDPVAEFTSMISLGPDEARTLVDDLRTHDLAPGLYLAELSVSGTFFSEDYELELDQAALEVLQIVAIPGIGPMGILLLILMMAGCGIWKVRRLG